MPQSLSAVYIHLVFSTKERRPFLRNDKLRVALHAYMSEVSKQPDCPPIITNGVEDRIHMLARLGRKITQADWVKELKRGSNIWPKDTDPTLSDFQWQGGYGDFSAGVAELDTTSKYIASQAEHHRKTTFQDEYRELLKRNNIEWDEKYVWD